MGEKRGMCAFCMRPVRLDRFGLVGNHGDCEGRGYPPIPRGQAIPVSWLPQEPKP